MSSTSGPREARKAAGSSSRGHPGRSWPAPPRTPARRCGATGTASSVRVLDAAKADRGHPVEAGGDEQEDLHPVGGERPALDVPDALLRRVEAAAADDAV